MTSFYDVINVTSPKYVIKNFLFSSHSFSKILVALLPDILEPHLIFKNRKEQR